MNLTPIGTVRSSLHDPSDAPRQGYEEARCTEATSSCIPPCQRYESLAAWLKIYPVYQDGLLGIRPGNELIVLAWLHLAKREKLQAYPRGDYSQPLTARFSRLTHKLKQTIE